MLSRVLVPVVSIGVAINVMHAPVVPALVRVVTAKAQGQAVPQSEGPGGGIVLGKIPVQPCGIPFGSLISVVMILQSIKEAGILKVDT
jgi:hypothetical protein